MKTLIFIIVSFFLAFPVNAAWWSKEEIKIEPKKEPPKPVYCNYSIDIGEGVFYIFRGGCEGFLQIGIIDVGENKLIFLSPKGKTTGFHTAATAIDRQKRTEENWGKINTVKFSSGK